ncbi:MULTISPECIES: TonB-dependent siderophore receptor [Marinobacter]|uniref:Metal-pseudopaline receptor CntO n=2 Tax=Marinobacter TaxID=2742 RepID=A0A455W855_MARNT|nr:MULTISPECIES: TonB-dependent siderophore receptor [unclassified Marinobacter]QFS86166.1 Ferrichrome-iron receptor precursor [Marinobacter sp. THAF197a]QFT49947.1 Ferrichrome-iron receptor precursor [Marinobacter sp. THAF39]BBJ03167.1 ferrisiderophore receptor [Marinobacter nauticus]
MQLPTSTKNKEYKHSPRGSWTAGLLTLAVSSTPALAQETLTPIDVSGERIEDPSAPVDGYIATSSRAGTKTNTPITEIPQSISVVTADQMQDQGVASVQEALRYTVGVGAEQFGLDSRGDWQSVRGGDPVIFLDGMQKTFGFYQSPRTEPYLLERIEVIRGPSSVLYGQGNVGGLVNLATKRPQAEQSTELKLQVGNHSRKQAAVDSTGALNKDGTLLYRFIALGRDSDTQVNKVEDNRVVIAPSITWRPTDQTEWTVMALHQEDRSGTTTQFLPIEGTLKPSPFGLPQIPIDLFISEPDFDRYNTKENAVTSLLSHQLNNVWTVRQSLRYSETEVDYQSIYPQFTPALKENGDIARVAYANKPNLDTLTADHQAEALFSTGNVDHTVLLGWDYQHAVSSSRRAYKADIGDLNVFNPVYGNYDRLTESDFSDTPENTVIQSGFYAQNQMTINDRWIAVLGLRHDSARNKTEGGTAFTDEEVTGRAGLMYKFSNGVTPFISYSESFKPVTGLDAFNNPFEPLKGEQVEVGVKYQPADSASLYTATVYDLREKNRQAPDPVNPNNQIQNGETSARGIELEAKVDVNAHWDLIANYAYTDTEVEEGNNKGARLPSIPAHTASIWSQHDLRSVGIPGLRAGAGVRYVGSSWDGTDQLKTPAETLLDAMIAYGRDNWELAVNVNNLTNETYFTTCLARGDCFIGTKRTVTGTLSYRF